VSLDLAALLVIARDAVTAAARYVCDHPPASVTGKGDRDMVSDTDLAVESRVRELLAARTPGIGLLGEEGGGPAFGDAPVWVLDPVDGTANFVRGLPLCAVSLGLVHRRRAVLGAIALPYLDRCYWAADGHGAWRDGVPIGPAPLTDLSDALVSVGDFGVAAGTKARNARQLALIDRLAARAQRVRMVGSAALDLLWVADGGLGASVALANKPWDTAAGVAIAREAGCTVTDAHGRPHTVDSAETVAAAPGLAADIAALFH